MTKLWEVDYKGHKIMVKNTWFNGELLYVDEELQDQQVGIIATRARLFGRIKSGEGIGEKIKVSLGASWFSTICQIFIDDKLVLANKS